MVAAYNQKPEQALNDFLSQLESIDPSNCQSIQFADPISHNSFERFNALLLKFLDASISPKLTMLKVTIDLRESAGNPIDLFDTLNAIQTKLEQRTPQLKGVTLFDPMALLPGQVIPYTKLEFERGAHVMLPKSKVICPHNALAHILKQLERQKIIDALDC